MRLFLFVFFSLSAYPQAPLATYLKLTGDQQNSLQMIETKLNQYVSGRTLRAFQLELEIRQERDRSTLDATAIGTRYVELETICRDARRRYQSAIDDARALLTAPQIARLKALEESLALLPTVAEADKSKLLDAPGIGPLTIQMGVLNSRPLPGCVAGQSPTVQTRSSPTIPGLDPPPQP